MKVPYLPSIRGKCIPANLNRVPSPEIEDEEELCLPVSIRQGKGFY